MRRISSGLAVLNAAPNVLVFSPTPTHRAIQGNRQRVFDMCRAMQSMGAKVTLLYYATEPVSAKDALMMTAAWDAFEVIFPHTLEHRHSLVRHPAIDDWFDEEIAAAISRLVSTRHFDVCVVNYVWYSNLLEVLPPNVVRLIDTHDVFGGRAEKFSEIGLDPAWFHTSVVQEGAGLDRADYVLAIQDEEARLLADRTSAQVVSVGWLSPDDFLPLRKRRAGEPLLVGYLASANPFNVASILNFAAAASNRPDVLEKIEFRVAGPVCDALRPISHPFQLCGIVDSVSEFYRNVDVAINPMLGGTGLKIKSLEAMRYGKPLVATAEAMTGIATHHSGHALSSPEAVLEHLLELATRNSLLAGEASISRDVYRRYREEQLTAFRSLWSGVMASVRSRDGMTARPDHPEGVA
ncbi:MAG TPA: glycosyltransferase [Rhizomicrobium sp.]|nr:glycosyltransferase [Rhizomicrobium sp.]